MVTFLTPCYFEQEVKAGDITPIEAIWETYPSMGQAQVRGALARTGLKKRAYLSSPF